MLSSSLTASHLAVACLIGLLCWAAFSDFLKFIIPNQVCIAIAALYPLYILAAGPGVDWAGGIACGMIVFALGFVFFALRLTGGGDVLYAFDSQTGAELWSCVLGQVGYANPMTYRASDGRQYVVIATGRGAGARLMAFALPGGSLPEEDR